MNRRKILQLGAALPFFGMGSAHAQSGKTISLVVPYAPGGTSDLLGRMIAQQASVLLKRPFIVENKPGAGSSLGAGQVARAAADGNTLLLATSSTLAINPALYKKLSYDPVKDFSPIGLVASVPLVIVVSPSSRANSLAELVALAKSGTEPLSYGSAGNGSPQHLAAEMFAAATGLKLTHVPYKGSGPALVDLLGGQLQLMFADIAPALPHIRAGKLRALAVSSRQRHPALPDIAPIAESGVAGTADFEAVAWQGVVAPAGLPRNLVEQYSSALNAVLDNAETRRWLVEQGMLPRSSTPEQLASLIKTDGVRWSKLIASAGLSLD